MKLKYIYASITLLSILLMTGCFEKDNYDPVSEVAWKFVKEKGWNGSEEGLEKCTSRKKNGR